MYYPTLKLALVPDTLQALNETLVNVWHVLMSINLHNLMAVMRVTILVKEATSFSLWHLLPQISLHDVASKMDQHRAVTFGVGKVSLACNMYDEVCTLEVHHLDDIILATPKLPHQRLNEVRQRLL